MVVFFFGQRLIVAKGRHEGRETLSTHRRQESQNSTLIDPFSPQSKPSLGAFIPWALCFMRYLFAPFMLLLAAAGCLISIGAVTALRGPSLATVDPAELHVVISASNEVKLEPAGQKLLASATNPATGQRVETVFDLERLALGSSNLRGIKADDGQSLLLYRLSAEDHARFAALQSQISTWRHPEHRLSNSLSLRYVASGCLIVDSAEREIGAEVWMSLDEGDSFVLNSQKIDFRDQFVTTAHAISAC